MSLIPSFTHDFIDGPGNEASGEQVMENLNLLRDTLNQTLGSSGTAFPGGPRDGQIFNFHAADGSLWVFRYNAGNSLWEFAGGGPVTGEEDGDPSGDEPGNFGPTIVIPRAGVYTVQYGHRTWHSTAGTYDTTLALRQAGAGVTGDKGLHYQSPDNDLIVDIVSPAYALTLAAGNLSLSFASSDTQGRSRFRWISVTPKAL